MAPLCFLWTSPHLFFFPSHTLYDTLRLISPPRCCSSFSLSGAVWGPFLPFPFVSSPRHFTGDVSTHWVSLSSSSQTFDPSDRAFYHLLSTAWFLLKWITFVASKFFSCQCRGLKFLVFVKQNTFVSANRNLRKVHKGILSWTSLKYCSRGFQDCQFLSWPLSFPSAIIAVIVIARSFNSCRRQRSQRPLNESLPRQFCRRSESN